MIPQKNGHDHFPLGAADKIPLSGQVLCEIRVLVEIPALQIDRAYTIVALAMEFAFSRERNNCPRGLMTPTKPIIWQGRDEAPLFGTPHFASISGQEA
jgi:hypothetical protein